MTAHAEIIPSVVDRIKRSLVGLKMPRAIEILDATVRRIERGEMNALEAIDALLAEELTLRENRRVKMALVMARLPGELYPRVGFIVTNMARPAENVVAFYNKRGTCEQWIREGKGAIRWTRLSCPCA
jgi:Transposase DDE domain group 1